MADERWVNRQAVAHIERSGNLAKHLKFACNRVVIEDIEKKA